MFEKQAEARLRRTSDVSLWSPSAHMNNYTCWCVYTQAHGNLLPSEPLSSRSALNLKNGHLAQENRGTHYGQNLCETQLMNRNSGGLSQTVGPICGYGSFHPPLLASATPVIGKEREVSSLGQLWSLGPPVVACRWRCLQGREIQVQRRRNEDHLGGQLC